MAKIQSTVAIVGCGAVTELRHLPALRRRQDCTIQALVDTAEERARKLASAYSVSSVFPDYQCLLAQKPELVIVALPNHLHARVCVDLLEAGIHVLVEKPMAMNVDECNLMIQAAERGRATLAVGMMRRFSHAGRFTRWAIESGLLGKISSFDIRDGGVFDWPLVSDFFFRREAAGGGVLIDTGVHTLDQMLWWLGGVDSFEYYDDSAGGVEAECELHLKLKNGSHGIVELSRTRNLRNTAIIRGEHAEIEVSLHKNALQLRYPDSPLICKGLGAPLDRHLPAEQSQIDFIAALHDDFINAVRMQRAPEAPGSAGRQSVALIEACYLNRRELVLPWMTQSPGVMQEAV